MLIQTPKNNLLDSIWCTLGRTANCIGPLVFSVLIIMFAPRDLGAQGNTAFTVSGVLVDVTSSSSADARNKALANGQRRAFERLLRRLVMSDDVLRLPKMTSGEIDEYVLDFAVDKEKNSPVRYLANLTFRFKPRQIRNLLRDFEIEFAETVSKPVLILPIYESAAAKSLWDNPNPWREAWGQLDLSGGLVPLKIPVGDLKDVGLVGAEQAVAGDEEPIRAIGVRYEVDTIMVAYGVLTSDFRGRPAIRVNVIPHGADQRASAMENFFMLKSDESIGSLLTRVVASTVTTIEDRWKENNLINFEQGSVLAAAMTIQSLSDWVEAQRRLRSVAVIERVDLVLFSRNEAHINIFYLGETEQLSLALAQADMQLEHEAGSWTLTLQQASRRLISIKPGPKNRGNR